jgi:hypothetical protein
MDVEAQQMLAGFTQQRLPMLFSKERRIECPPINFAPSLGINRRWFDHQQHLHVEWGERVCTRLAESVLAISSGRGNTPDNSGGGSEDTASAREDTASASASASARASWIADPATLEAAAHLAMCEQKAADLASSTSPLTNETAPTATSAFATALRSVGHILGVSLDPGRVLQSLLHGGSGGGEEEKSTVNGEGQEGQGAGDGAKQEAGGEEEGGAEEGGGEKGGRKKGERKKGGRKKGGHFPSTWRILSSSTVLAASARLLSARA